MRLKCVLQECHFIFTYKAGKSKLRQRKGRNYFQNCQKLLYVFHESRCFRAEILTQPVQTSECCYLSGNSTSFGCKMSFCLCTSAHSSPSFDSSYCLILDGDKVQLLPSTSINLDQAQKNIFLYFSHSQVCWVSHLKADSLEHEQQSISADKNELSYKIKMQFTVYSMK